MLYAIERSTQQKIPLLQLPSTAAINDQRIARFKQMITNVLATEDLGLFRTIIEQYQQEHNITALDVASALAKMAQGNEPLLLAANAERERRPKAHQDRSANQHEKTQPAKKSPNGHPRRGKAAPFPPKAGTTKKRLTARGRTPNGKKDRHRKRKKV